jgi:hypothetical protein
MCIIARIRSGKTTLVSYLCDYFMSNKKFDRIMVFCGSGEKNGDYSWMPPEYVSKFNIDIVRKIQRAQETYIDKHGKEKSMRILIIFDDIISKTNQEGRDVISELYAAGSHYNMSIILLTQRPSKEFPPAARENTLYWLISNNTPIALKTVHEYVDYAGTKQDFIKFVNKNTMDYKFLLNDYATMKEEGVHNENTNFWYQIKAEPLPKGYKITFPGRRPLPPSSTAQQKDSTKKGVPPSTPSNSDSSEKDKLKK